MGNICSWGQPEGRFPFVFPNRPRFLQEPLIHRRRASRSGKGPVGVVFEPIFPLARQKCWEPSAAIASRRSRMAVKGACHAQPDRQRTRPDSRSIGLTRSQCLFRCDSSLTTGTWHDKSMHDGPIYRGSPAVAASVTIAGGAHRRTTSVNWAVVHRFVMPCPGCQGESHRNKH